MSLFDSMNESRISEGMNVFKWDKEPYKVAREECKQILKMGQSKYGSGFETSKYVVTVIQDTFMKCKVISAIQLSKAWFENKHRGSLILSRGKFSAISIKECKLGFIVSQVIVGRKRESSRLNHSPNLSPVFQNEGSGKVQSQDEYLMNCGNTPKEKNGRMTTMFTLGTGEDDQEWVNRMIRDVFMSMAMLGKQSSQKLLVIDSQLVRIAKSYCRDIVEFGATIEDKYHPLLLQVSSSEENEGEYGKLFFDQLRQSRKFGCRLTKFKHVGLATAVDKERVLLLLLFHARKFNLKS